MLTVYKASAGSGKTFQLVVEYLKLLLENPENYKSILAVTFTNKATTEMKSRILEQLNLLAKNKKSDYLDVLLKSGTFSEKTIRERAQKALKNILHDFNRFSINTIDSFTQKVIKAFNRELGISPQLVLEMDNDMILSEAVDNLLSKIGNNKKQLNWLKEFSREKIENNKSQQINDDIIKLGNELFKENFQTFFPENGESVYSRENLDNFSKELQKFNAWFETELKSLGKKTMNSILKNGFLVDDFLHKKNGVAGYIKNIAEGNVKEPGKRVLEASTDVEKWYSKIHKQKNEIHRVVSSELQNQLNEILLFYNSHIIQYNTGLAVFKQFRMLGILMDVREEVKLILNERGLLQLSDSNLLLNKIIGESDAPFVYEKTGNSYKHFMLDEFQDTSGLQWKNFKPLVQNSLAEGHSNLIVGDVKQSIYRWRNSDWNILAEQLNNDFDPRQKTEKTLGKNFRSDKNIIGFNNHIFEELTLAFKTYLFSNLENGESYSEKFSHIYSNYIQHPGKPGKQEEGCIKINFLEEEDFSENATNLLVEQVKELQDKGIKASEIAILIRKNNEGASIVERFLKEAKKPENSAYDLTVLSNESLFLYASNAVLFVTGMLKFLLDPGNKLIQAQLLLLWKTWLVPELRKKNIPPGSENNENSIDSKNDGSWALQNDFEEKFESELGEKIKSLRKKIVLSSPDETINFIAYEFGLFNFESEIPFLQTLIDKAGELKQTQSNDLASFVHWWDEKNSKTSVSINENINSIRLLTVHKAKGLEFKAVIIPYFNWKTSWTTNPILWCTPKNKPFSSFPLLPVLAENLMALTEFKEDYFLEKANYYIDTLNLIYVAFTRAKSVLYINSPAIKEKSDSNSGSVPPVQFLLKKALEKLSAQSKFSNCFDEEKSRFEFGEIHIKSLVEEKKESNSIPVSIIHFADFSEKIRLRMNSENFLVAGEKQQSVKNAGKLIHEILAGINTKTDVEKACTKALKKGIITESEKKELEQRIYQNLDLPEASEWFSNKYQVLNEREILTSEKTLRPDRIMFLADEAIVVDYKTGDIQPGKYDWQVKRYAQNLKESGFKKVSGYLWYISKFEIQKVCDF